MAGTITTDFHANEPEVVLLPTSRYAAIRQTISDWATGRAGPQGCSADEFANLIAGDVLGSSSANGGLVWKGPNSAAVEFMARWCPGGLLVSSCLIDSLPPLPDRPGSPTVLVV